MKIFLFIYITLTIFCIYTVEAAKKKRKRPRSDQPIGFDTYLYCSSCRAIAQEMVKKVKDSKSEIQVYDAARDICNINNFHDYDYPAADIRKGCLAFINGNEDTILDVFLHRTDNEGIIDKLCLEETKACEGVDLSLNEGFNSVNISGVEYSIAKNGTLIVPPINDEL